MSPFIGAHGPREKNSHTPDMFKLQQLSGSNKNLQAIQPLSVPLHRNNSVETKKSKKRPLRMPKAKKGINTQKEISKIELLHDVFFFQGTLFALMDLFRPKRVRVRDLSRAGLSAVVCLVEGRSRRSSLPSSAYLGL